PLSYFHHFLSLSLMLRRPLSPTLFPYTTLFRSRSIPPRAGSRCPSFRPSRAQSTSVERNFSWQPIKVSAKASTPGQAGLRGDLRSEEHTSELQSRENLVCRLLLEKKKKK